MRVPGAALAAILVLAVPARADGWAFREGGGGQAGYVADGAFAGLWLACTPSGARLSVATGSARLAADAERTVVLDVDGTAYLQRMRAAGTQSGPALSRAMSRAAMRELAEALAKGRKAEISTPAGRFALPLNGSGKALQAFLASCP